MPKLMLIVCFFLFITFLFCILKLSDSCMQDLKKIEVKTQFIEYKTKINSTEKSLMVITQPKKTSKFLNKWVLLISFEHVRIIRIPIEGRVQIEPLTPPKYYICMTWFQFICFFLLHIFTFILPPIIIIYAISMGEGLNTLGSFFFWAAYSLFVFAVSSMYNTFFSKK